MATQELPSQESQQSMPNDPIPKSKKLRRRQVVTSEWKLAKRRIERLSRPVALRFGKLNGAQIDMIIREALGEEVEEDDAYYLRSEKKIRTNAATWKNRSIESMKVS